MVRMNRIMVSATSGEPRICTVKAWLRPTTITTTMMNPTVRGMPATAVTRWSQKCPVPDLAEPRPRAWPSGVRMLIANSSRLSFDHDLFRKTGTAFPDHDLADEEIARDP